MLNKVIAAAERYSLLKRGDSVTVALSGGADSTALLHAMLSLRDKYSLTITAAHVNHMLRGDESDRDERFVRDMCERLGVPLEVGRFDINALRRQGESCEECARRVRYGFLNECADGKIATAHTADDNAETVLFNLTRGSGIKGACGIPPRRDNIIRPLIMCSRADVEGYCRENGLDFVIDSTNLTDDYTRNRIRHNVVPALREINPAVADSFCRFSAAMRDADDLISQLASDAANRAKSDFGYDCAELCRLHKAVLHRAVQLICKNESGFTPDSPHTEEVCRIIENAKGRCQLSGGFFAEIKDGKLFILREKKTENNPVTPCCDFVNKTVKFGDFEVKTALFDRSNVNNLLANDILDYDKIIGNLILRTRREGDKIKLAKRPQKSLKKLFCELKIPREKRDKLPVLADGRGVIFVLGIGCDIRVKADENTKRVLVISGVERE